MARPNNLVSQSEVVLLSNSERHQQISDLLSYEQSDPAPICTSSSDFPQAQIWSECNCHNYPEEQKDKLNSNKPPNSRVALI